MRHERHAKGPRAPRGPEAPPPRESASLPGYWRVEPASGPDWRGRWGRPPDARLRAERARAPDDRRHLGGESAGY
ncbi:MAG: hypothetical protein R2752_19385 [Vicinamibacterales bacterium]